MTFNSILRVLRRTNQRRLKCRYLKFTTTLTNRLHWQILLLHQWAWTATAFLRAVRISIPNIYFHHVSGTLLIFLNLREKQTHPVKIGQICLCLLRLPIHSVFLLPNLTLDPLNFSLRDFSCLSCSCPGLLCFANFSSIVSHTTLYICLYF